MIWIYIIAAVAAALALFLLCAGTYLLFVNGIVSSNRKKDKAPLSCWEEDEDAPETVRSDGFVRETLYQYSSDPPVMTELTATVRESSVSKVSFSDLRAIPSVKSVAITDA